MKYLNSLKNETVNNNTSTTQKGIDTMTTSTYLINNTNEYINTSLNKEIDFFSNYKHLKSGYENLDVATSLYPGLYVLGAVSSLGKTTFIHQMADQIAMSGTPVLYISLEMSTLELVSKSLARESAIINQLDADKSKSAIDIRSEGILSMEMQDIVDSYSQKAASNLTIAESTFGMSIKDIEKVIEDYIQESKIAPVVIIDYLQCISIGENIRAQIDDVVRTLKQIQKRNSLTMFVISSFNRANYTKPVDFTSFKESGMIEYTADVVWGLQLSEVSSVNFENASDDEKRKLYQKAKSENPRKVELVVLKNRFGEIGNKFEFTYYPKYDLFLPLGISISNYANHNHQGFHQLTIEELFKFEDAPDGVPFLNEQKGGK